MIEYREQRELTLDARLQMGSDRVQRAVVANNSLLMQDCRGVVIEYRELRELALDARLSSDRVQRAAGTHS